MNTYYNYASLEPSVGTCPCRFQWGLQYGTQPLRCRGASVPIPVEIGLYRDYHTRSGVTVNTAPDSWLP